MIMEQQALYVDKKGVADLNKELKKGWKVVSVTALHITGDNLLTYEKVYEAGAIVILERMVR